MPQNDKDVEEISASIGLTESGGSVTLKGRIFSAMDWLGARWLRSKAKPLNEAVLLGDAVVKAEIAIIEAAADRLVKDISEDSQLAARALSVRGKGCPRANGQRPTVDICNRRFVGRPTHT